MLFAKLLCDARTKLYPMRRAVAATALGPRLAGPEKADWRPGRSPEREQEFRDSWRAAPDSAQVRRCPAPRSPAELLQGRSLADESRTPSSPDPEPALLVADSPRVDSKVGRHRCLREEF